jgi:hypothetical protein
MRIHLRLLSVGGLSILPVAPVHSQDATPHVLILSDQARHFLTLEYSPHATELLGCLIGSLRSDTVIVDRIAPAHVDPVHSTPTHVIPRERCEDAGWGPVVGTVHNHPEAQACFFLFPGTRVPAGDGESFLRSSYPISAILCGLRLVWITRAMTEEEFRLDSPSPKP